MFRIATGQTSVKWYPLGDDTLLVQPGFEFSDTYYPNNETISTKENKFYLNTRHRFWKNWTQELQYEDLWIANDKNRLARDGEGNDMPDNPLVKRRHTIAYNLKFPFVYDTTLQLKQRGRRQTSNDAFTDFYDYYSYKVTTELSRPVTRKLHAKASLSFEQKDYSFRTVSALQVAQEDRSYAQKINLYYFLDQNWLVNYTWSRAKVDSNNTLYDYEKLTHLIGVYYSF